MKIAICFSGQMRTWKKCADTWEILFQRISSHYNASIDIFLHTWTSNTLPHEISVATNPDNFSADEGVNVDSREISDLLLRLKPVDFLVEDTRIGLKKVGETTNENLRHNLVFGDPVVSWASPQFYSVMRAAHLKKKHEYKNNFRYDICFRMRHDLYFSGDQIEHFMNSDIVMPTANTVYPCHTRSDHSCFPFVRFGDIFWFADSTSFDRICEFYRWIPIIGSKSFSGSGTTPVSVEHALYFYSKMIKMNVSPISVDPRIFRSAEHIRARLKSNLSGSSGSHELI